MRAIHWKVIPKSRLDNTIWARNLSPSTTKASELEHEELTELETLFREQQPTKKAEKKSAKPRVVTLIDKQRSQGIEIVLKGIKLPHEEIVGAIAAMDAELVSADQLYSLLQLYPAQRDAELLQGYEGDLALLAAADRFLLQLLAIPSIEKKLHSFLFKLQLPGSMDDVGANLALVQKACAEVQDSKELAKVLALALTMGNVLNQGKRALGKAGGIALASLSKLKDTKSSDKKTNLLRHLAAVLVRKHGSDWIRGFGKSMPSLSAAAHISMTDVAADIKQMLKGLDMCASLLQQSGKGGDAPPEDMFCEKLRSFHASSAVALDKLQKHVQASTEQFESLCRYVGEDEATSTPGTVFLTVGTFCSMLVQAHEENEQAARQEASRKKQREKRASAEKKSQERSAGDAPARWRVVLSEPSGAEAGCASPGGGWWRLSLEAPAARGRKARRPSALEPEEEHNEIAELLNDIRGKGVAERKLRKVVTPDDELTVDINAEPKPMAGPTPISPRTRTLRARRRRLLAEAEESPKPEPRTATPKAHSASKPVAAMPLKERMQAAAAAASSGSGHPSCTSSPSGPRTPPPTAGSLKDRMLATLSPAELSEIYE